MSYELRSRVGGSNEEVSRLGGLGGSGDTSFSKAGDAHRFVPMFNPHDFHLWTSKMKILLIHRELWGLVEGTATAGADTDSVVKFEKNKAEAIYLLSVSLGDAWRTVMNFATPKEVWDHLAQVHSVKSVAHRMRILSMYQERKLGATEGPATFLADMRRLKIDLERSSAKGRAIDDDEQVAQILMNLPDDWDGFVTAVNARGGVALADVEALILEEGWRRLETSERRERERPAERAMIADGTRRGKPRHDTGRGRRASGGGAGNDSADGSEDSGDSRDSFEDRCYYCGKKGHILRHCRARKNKTQRKKNSDGGKAEARGDQAAIARHVALTATEAGGYNSDFEVF
jgi:hypothetical protein